MVCNKHNTLGSIKYPFWQIAARNPETVYVCVNHGETYAPEEIREKLAGGTQEDVILKTL